MIPEQILYMRVRQAEQSILKMVRITVVRRGQEMEENVVMPDAELMERLGLHGEGLMTIFNCVRALDIEHVSDAIQVLLRWLTSPRDQLEDLEFDVLKLLLRLCLIFVRPPREDRGEVAIHIGGDLFEDVIRAARERLSNAEWDQRLDKPRTDPRSS
jgi:hypothetical protein